MGFPNSAGRLLIFSAIYPYNCLKSLDPDTKLTIKRRYVCTKRWIAGCSAVGYGSLDAAALVKDIVRAEVKSKGYKMLGTVIIGPFLQVLSLPLYIFTAGFKIQRYAVALAQLGAFIIEFQFTIINMGFLATDLFLFGQPIPMFDENTSLLIYHNDTTNALMTIASDEFELTNGIGDIASSIIPEVNKNVSDVLSATTDIVSHGNDVISTLNSLQYNITGTDSN
jgi:hypothetical protein